MSYELEVKSFTLVSCGLTVYKDVKKSGEWKEERGKFRRGKRGQRKKDRNDERETEVVFTP